MLWQTRCVRGSQQDRLNTRPHGVLPSSGDGKQMIRYPEGCVYCYVFLGFLLAGAASAVMFSSSAARKVLFDAGGAVERLDAGACTSWLGSCSTTCDEHTTATYTQVGRGTMQSNQLQNRRREVPLGGDCQTHSPAGGCR